MQDVEMEENCWLLPINPAGGSSIRSLYEHAPTQPVAILKPKPIALVARLACAGRSEDQLVSEVTRKGNNIIINIKDIGTGLSLPRNKVPFVRASLPESLPPGRYYATLFWQEYVRDSSGELQPRIETMWLPSSYLCCMFDVAGPDGRSPEANRPLPGNLSIAQAVGNGDVRVVVCESKGPTLFRFDKDVSLCYASDEAVVQEVIAGDANVGDVLRIPYILMCEDENPVFKGQKVIWITPLRGNWAPFPKALADTPENRKAVIAAIAEALSKPRPTSSPSRPRVSTLPVTRACPPGV